MHTNNILSASLIDILFDGRNKNYGAYELRKTYPKRLLISIFIMSILVGLVFGGAALGLNTKKKIHVRADAGGILLKRIDETKTIQDDKPKPKEKVKDVKTRSYSEPVIVDKDKLEKPLTPIPDLEGAQIDLGNKERKEYDGTVQEPTVRGKGTDIVESKNESFDDSTFRAVEVQAKFSGNWVSFLLKNLRADVPVDNAAPAGTYSVIIQFVVDREGNVSEVKAMTAHGFGMEEEAIRVIKKSSKWEPAIQNGIKVKAYHRQVVTFQVVE